MLRYKVIGVLLICFFVIASCHQRIPKNQINFLSLGKGRSLKTTLDTLKPPLPQIIESEELIIDQSKLKVVKQNFSSVKVKAKRNYNGIGQITTIELPGLSNMFKSGSINMVIKDTTIHGETILIERSPSVKAKQPFYRDNAIYDIQCLGVDEGLNSGYILSVMEDSRSNIWFGYFNGGIGKYDGSSFTNLTKESGLPNNNVWSLLEDSRGNIWFGLMDRGGLIKYDGSSYVLYEATDEFLGNIIWSLFEDKNQNLWLGTDRGIVRFDGQSFTSFISEDLAPRSGVFSIMEDQKGHIWFGTRNGVIVYNGNSFIRYSSDQGFPESRVFSILEAPKGHIWMGTDRGAFKLSDTSMEIFTTKDGLSSDVIRDVDFDNQGNIWLGTINGGLCKFDGKGFQSITKEEGLPGNLVRDIHFDSSNNLWASVQGVGVIKYKPDSFNHHIFKEPIFEQHVAAIHQDKHGAVWFGMTYNGGLSKYNGDYFEHFQPNNDQRSISINEISSDEQGHLWMATINSGLIKYDGENFVHYTEAAGLKNNKIRATYVDSKNAIWFSSPTGWVSKLEGRTLTHFSLIKETVRSNIVEIMEDDQGNIWFATERAGACKYDGKTFTFYSEDQGLADNFVFGLKQDSKKNMWFGTFNGLSKLDDTGFTNYTKKDGLPDNFAGEIKEDKAGNIWFGTDRGLGCAIYNKKTLSLLKDQDYKDGLIVSYKIADGLKEMEGSAMLIDNDNNLWYGSATTMSSMNLDQKYLNIKPPKLQLNTIEINGKFIDFKALIHNTSYAESTPFLTALKSSISSPKPFNNYPETLQLSYNNNHLTFRFSAIDWTAPHDLKYTYMIDGLDREWSTPDEENKADYRNIPPGSYTFKVKGKDKLGQWSTIKSYPFVISPPWWLSKTFLGVYFVLGILCVWLIVKLYTYRMRKKQIELEQMVANRTRTISLQKEELSLAYADLEKERNKFELKALINQINPHFIFNALNSIQQFILGNNVKTSLDYFNKFGKLIRFSLEHSEKKFVSIDEEINVLQNYVAIENLRFEEPVDLKFNVNEISIAETKIPPMFIQPFIENSIIHGLSHKKTNKVIEVTFEEHEEYITCSIEDNGQGRKRKENEHNKNSGLVITQNRLKSVWPDNLKQSKIEFFDLKNPDNTGRGTKVIIRLPKDF